MDGWPWAAGWVGAQSAGSTQAGAAGRCRLAGAAEAAGHRQRRGCWLTKAPGLAGGLEGHADDGVDGGRAGRNGGALNASGRGGAAGRERGISRSGRWHMGAAASMPLLLPFPAGPAGPAPTWGRRAHSIERTPPRCDLRTWWPRPWRPTRGRTATETRHLERRRWPVGKRGRSRGGRACAARWRRRARQQGAACQGLHSGQAGTGWPGWRRVSHTLHRAVCACPAPWRCPGCM